MDSRGRTSDILHNLHKKQAQAGNVLKALGEINLSEAQNSREAKEERIKDYCALKNEYNKWLLSDLATVELHHYMMIEAATFGDLATAIIAYNNAISMRVANDETHRIMGIVTMYYGDFLSASLVANNAIIARIENEMTKLRINTPIRSTEQAGSPSLFGVNPHMQNQSEAPRIPDAHSYLAISRNNPT